MPKIIGCMTAWGAKDFILPALKQAEEYCDEVFICVAPHSEAMKEFEDGTKAIARQFAKRSELIKLVDWNEVNFHASTKANILNAMLSKSKYRKPGNWIWILDVDEFYPEKTYQHIRNFVDGSKNSHTYDRVEFQEYYFYINMWNYLEGSHLRMFKIKDERNVFQPTQRWVYAEKPIVFDFQYCPMYHYGMLTNPHAKIKFWQSEYQGKQQTNKVHWLEYIYRNYDLKNQGEWLFNNQALFNIYSPWFSDSFKPDLDGRLYKYDVGIHGHHPKFIGKELQEVNDFRQEYNFLPNKKKVNKNGS